MKIENKTTPFQGLENKKITPLPANGGNKSPQIQAFLNQDKVENGLFKQLKQRIHDTPEVDRTKVENLKTQIQEGKYHVSSNALALSMLRSAGKEDLESGKWGKKESFFTKMVEKKYWPKVFSQELLGILKDQLRIHQDIVFCLEQESLLPASTRIETIEKLIEEKSRCIDLSETKEKERLALLEKIKAQVQWAKPENWELRSLLPFMVEEDQTAISEIYLQLKGVIETVKMLSQKVKLISRARLLSLNESIQSINVYISSLPIYSAQGSLKKQKVVRFLNRQA